jgi:uncharacterized membrane protein (DUF485 family)
VSKIFLKSLLELVKICGVIVFVLGFTALVGHITKVSALHTWFETPMSLNTSIALVFAGLGLFICGIRLDGIYEKQPRKVE